eukprot:NODE_16_length_49026_cov_1.035992.p12 type:complete len:337 gc:universal NODE_16_length_49026_cov_1.035992:41836-42846(+)
MISIISEVIPYYGWIMLVYAFTFYKTMEFKKQRKEDEEPLQKIIKTNLKHDPLDIYVLRPLKGYKSYLQNTLVLDNENPLFKLHNIFILDEDDPVLDDILKIKFENSATTTYTIFIKLHTEQKMSVDTNLTVEQKNIKEYKHYINHKIQSLASCIDHFKMKGYIWNLDDNVYINKDTLKTTLCKLESKHIESNNWEIPKLGDPHCILWHHVCLGVNASDSAYLEAMFLNTLHTIYYIFINITRIDSCLMGKSIVFPSSLLDHKDIDLHVYQDILAEDNAFGQAVWKKDVPHEMIGFAYNVLGRMKVDDVVQRRMRWTRLRKYNVPMGNLYLCRKYY